MRLLLDTQTILWYLDKNPRLGHKAKQAIMDADTVFVSSISTFEITIKTMLGKLEAPVAFGKTIAGLGFGVLSFTDEAAEAVRQFPSLVRHDPFDRMILAQARTEGLRLLTADQVLLDLGLSFVIDARK